MLASQGPQLGQLITKVIQWRNDALALSPPIEISQVNASLQGETVVIEWDAGAEPPQFRVRTPA